MMRTPRDIIAANIGQITASAILDALAKEGWIVVRHDAIRLAQREARYEALEDVRMGLVKV